MKTRNVEIYVKPFLSLGMKRDWRWCMEWCFLMLISDTVEYIRAVDRDKWKQISLLSILSKTFQVHSMGVEWDCLSTAEVCEWIYIRVTHRNHNKRWDFSSLLNLPLLHIFFNCMIFHSHWSQKLDYRLPYECLLELHIPAEDAALSVWYNIR